MITIKCPNCGKGFTTTEHTWSEVIEIGKAYFKSHNKICEKRTLDTNCEVNESRMQARQPLTRLSFILKRSVSNE